MHKFNPREGPQNILDDHRQFQLADLGFPSPANEDLSVAGADDVADAGSAALQSAYQTGLLSSPLKPLPSPLIQRNPSSETSTPLHEISHTEFEAARIFEGLPPPPDTAPIPKSARANLRLPSFDLLGIAAPHPDRIRTRNTDHGFPVVGAGPPSKPDDPLHTLSPALERVRLPTSSADDNQSPLTISQPRIEPELSNPIERPGSEYVTTFTPPEESNDSNWKSVPNVRTTAMDSPAKSDQPTSSHSTGTTAPTTQQGATSGSSITAITTGGRNEPWLANALRSALEPLPVRPSSNGSVKVLSHALPTPSPSGHIFPIVISAIYQRISPRPTVWINVFHAVPGRFNISDLPTSPPNTPGPAIGGDDYFTAMVFDSAVAVTDYQDILKRGAQSPRPVVPPSTVNISVVERYIPPTNINEFNDLYSPSSGRSLLSDRLVELSYKDGTLIFIYPTKTGGQTFQKEYLGPIVEPLLRSMAIINSFPADLSATLGQMSSVDSLLEYPEMHSKLIWFCEQLTHTSTPLANFHSQKGVSYSIIHASKEEVMLGREAWSDWWMKQEKPKVRSVLTKYFKLGQKNLPQNTQEEEVIPTHLIQQILDGVAQRSYEGKEPKKGVEVGVFVIKKSA